MIGSLCSLASCLGQPLTKLSGASSALVQLKDVVETVLPALVFHSVVYASEDF